MDYSKTILKYLNQVSCNYVEHVIDSNLDYLYLARIQLLMEQPTLVTMLVQKLLALHYFMVKK
jgi:hypothetical protein